MIHLADTLPPRLRSDNPIDPCRKQPKDGLPIRATLSVPVERWEKVEFAGPVGPIRFDPSHQSPLDFYVTQVQSMRHVVLDKVPNQRDPEEADCRRTW